MPGTPAASRTPAGRAPAASKLPRFQKARPPTIRTMLLQDDYDDLNPNGTLPDQLTVNEGKGGPVDARDVSPGKKRGPRSENGRPEGSSGTPSRKSIVGSGSKDGAPKSKLGQAETAPQKQTVKTPTAASASAYASPYGQRKEKPKEKPRGAKSETSPLSNTSPRSPTSPGTFSQKSNGTAYSEPERNRNEPERNRNATENGAAGPESAIKAQVAEALHVLDHLEAHADALGSPSAAYGASEKAFGASEKSFSASEKAFNTSGKASAAVERGHGASNKGFGASESVYGAFATNGAMQSGRGPRGEVRSARRGGAAAAYASRVKKKAEEKKQLGARKDHAVQVARGIMRKVSSHRCFLVVRFIKSSS